jgi:hypothetical protein
MKRTIVALAFTVALTLTGCGGGGSPTHVVDTVAWQQDLNKYGVTVADWPKYLKVMKGLCNDSADEIGAYVGVALDGGNSRGQLRVEFQNACPSRVSDVEAAFSGIDEVQTACSLAPADRTQAQANEAEAMGC